MDAISFSRSCSETTTSPVCGNSASLKHVTNSAIRIVHPARTIVTSGLALGPLVGVPLATGDERLHDCWTPLTRTGNAVPSLSAAGSKASGQFWKATGRSQRRTAVAPTDVCSGAVVAGYGPP